MHSTQNIDDDPASGRSALPAGAGIRARLANLQRVVRNPRS